MGHRLQLVSVDIHAISRVSTRGITKWSGSMQHRPMRQSRSGWRSVRDGSALFALGAGWIVLDGLFPPANHPPIPKISARYLKEMVICLSESIFSCSVVGQ